MDVPVAFVLVNLCVSIGNNSVLLELPTSTGYIGVNKNVDSLGGGNGDEDEVITAIVSFPTESWCCFSQKYPSGALHTPSFS